MGQDAEQGVGGQRLALLFADIDDFKRAVVAEALWLARLSA